MRAFAAMCGYVAAQEHKRQHEKTIQRRSSQRNESPGVSDRQLSRPQPESFSQSQPRAPLRLRRGLEHVNVLDELSLIHI